MKINEVEKLLNITRANIRFYEKEQLLMPTRGKNRYRDYSEEDVARLKKVIILRKLGISVADIRQILDGDLPLDAVLEQNIHSLQEQIEELNGALEVCRQMEHSHVTIGSMDESYYWDVIHTKEKNGGRFRDLLEDCARFELDLFAYQFLMGTFEENRKSIGLRGILLTVLAVCIGCGLVRVFVFREESFLYGFFYPLQCFVLLSIIVLPIYLLGKKHLKAATVLFHILLAVCILFLVLVGLLIIVCLLNAKLHFWF